MHLIRHGPLSITISSPPYPHNISYLKRPYLCPCNVDAGEVLHLLASDVPCRPPTFEATQLVIPVCCPRIEGEGVTSWGITGPLLHVVRTWPPHLNDERLTIQPAGHCRRRKIRCLVANDDLLQRCLNCIKLKKECSFLPVDHPPNEERRSRTGSRAEAASGEGSGSSSSSPPIGSVVDQMETFNHFAPLPLSTQEYPSSTSTMSPHVHGRSSTINAASRATDRSAAHLSARPYEYTQHHEQPPWDSPYMDHGPLSAGNSTPDDPSQNYWRSPLTPAFPAQFSGPPTSSSSRESGGSFTSFAPLSHGLGFPMPPRSMSVHGGQDFHRNYQIHYSPAYETDIQRRASEMMRPPSLQASRHSSNTSISEASGTPLSFPPNQWPAPQTNWAPLTGPPLAKQPDFWGYSPEPGLPQVQEEDVPPPFGSPPAIVYSDAAHQ
jgi:hypothetical protein